MRYVAILRGINISGQKKIKMADLKTLFESLNLSNVQTYIQSGNVIFDSNEKEEKKLKTVIESSIQKRYDFEVPVEIRSRDALQGIVTQCPFHPVDIETQGTKVLVTFLSIPPSADKIVDIEKYVVPPEALLVHDREVYLHCPNGYGKTKLSNTFLERKLGVVATTRNWKTVCQLQELAS